MDKQPNQNLGYSRSFPLALGIIRAKSTTQYTQSKKEIALIVSCILISIYYNP